MHSAVTVKV